MIIDAKDISITDSTVATSFLSSLSNETTLPATLPACSHTQFHEPGDGEIVETTRCSSHSTVVHFAHSVSPAALTLPLPIYDLADRRLPNQSPTSTSKILQNSTRAGNSVASNQLLTPFLLVAPADLDDLITESVISDTPLPQTPSAGLLSKGGSETEASTPSTESLAENNLEECVISSSVEDHHYCSLIEFRENPTPALGDSSTKSPIHCRGTANASSGKSTERSKSIKLAGTSISKRRSKSSSTIVLSKSRNARGAKGKNSVTACNLSASIPIGSDCFKRFYLQRQVGGTFSIVPVGEAATISNTDKSTPKALNSISLSSPRNSCSTEQLSILNEPSLKLEPLKTLMRIDKASLALDPAVAPHFSLADFTVGHAKRPLMDNMSGQGSKPSVTFGSAMRSQGKSHYQQQPHLSHPQSRAILSAAKHDTLTSTVSMTNNQLNSPPPVVISSSNMKLGSTSMEETDFFPLVKNSSLANFSVQGSPIMDQNMLVASLPPVETILSGDRGSVNSSHMANFQPSEEQDFGMGIFAPTTIIHDQHIVHSYYGHVDSTVDDDDELLANSKCLPFGYFYDDDKVFNQLQVISSSLPSSNSSSPVLDVLDPLSDLFNSSTEKSTEKEYINANFDYINEMAFEFNNAHPGQQSSSPLDSSSMGQSSVPSLMMTCDNDPLISGNDFGNLRPHSKNTTFLKSMNMNSTGEQRGNTSGTLIGGKTLPHNTFPSGEQINGQLINRPCGDSLLMESGHSYSCNKKGSPMINSATPGPTLAQLNLQLPMKEEEEEMINWPNGDQNSFTNGGTLQNTMGLKRQQQHNMISSSSSPTVKINPIVASNMDSKYWFQNTVPMIEHSGQLLNTSNGSAVTSSLEDLTVPEIDDSSLEIENILQQNPLLVPMNDPNGLYGGNQPTLASPPKLSSSLPMSSFKSPSVQKQKIKKPNFVSQQSNQAKTLLSELLTNSNMNEILRSNGSPSMVINVNSNQMNLVTKQSGQGLAQSASGTAQSGLNYSGGKSMFNCPTLTALITSPNINSSASPMLSSAALLPSISSLSSGQNMATILANNNRNRNNSMSTDYSVSSHDEGFASQPEEESESDDNSEDQLMLIQDDNEDLIENELFFMDNMATLANNAFVNASPSNCQQNVPMNSHELFSPADGNLVNALTHNNTTQISLDLLTSMKEEPMWGAASQPQAPISEHTAANCQPASKYPNSTSSAIDDNESIASDEEDDDDESFYGDYDASDLLGATTSDDINNKWSLNMGRSRKGSEKRFFWQYNVQSKGPKGPRYIGPSTSSFDDEEDPHIFNEISDPVFAPDCQIEGVKHSGKARRGDGNDLTPNPKKLLMIGLELKKLSKTINDLTPVTDVPFTCRNKSRKEKNKLASRACRLKKKAQHEANKIKLHGLHREHARMMKVISEMSKIAEIGRKMVENNKPVLVQVEGVTYQMASVASLGSLLEEMLARFQDHREVSGRTADFVNHILDNVSSGISNGGIENV